LSYKKQNNHRKGNPTRLRGRPGKYPLNGLTTLRAYHTISARV
jgi:hypothetical protein